MEGVVLWRRFRCLALELRLEIFHLFLKFPALCVKQASEKLGQDENNTGKHLQELAVCGFLEAERRGKFLFYHVRKGDCLTDAVLQEIHRTEADYAAIVRVVTAFTHERRILIVRQLKKKSVEFSHLCNQCHISEMAMNRHLKKLSSRNLVCRKDGVWQLDKPAGLFCENLIQIVLGNTTPDQV